MDPEDPFAIFQEKQKRPLSSNQIQGNEPRKRVHLDPMAQLQANIHQQVKQNLQEPIIESDMDAQQQNKIKIQNIEIVKESSDQGCIHEVFYPKGYQRKTYEGSYTAKVYPFNLDHFQKKSIHAIQCDQSVLVCAHTSAGKTAIAEYAIATSLNRNSRVIYTSPIKALSNQKYRQLKQQFGDVGLVTGDTSIDQDATCLVMTTEILRNMIYRGSEIVRQTKWVIFDQVHYMRDKQRGVVWEETIIMLPSNVKYVFLSATIGNPSQFACWITKLRKQPCNVVYTDFRPVPLEHYLCPAGGQGIYMVVDENGKFYENNFNKAIQTLGDSVNVVGVDKKKKKGANQGSDLAKIIKVIIQRNLQPAIVFSFSKKDVQAHAKAIVTKYDLTTKAQKQKIKQIFDNAVNVLGDDSEDKNIPQIQDMLPILLKGIGIHHGGLLPLIKEVIQLLFQQGYLKILFSTETFSMGLNMPARTVVFTSIQKWDGQKTRLITGGQYIQMSGRAGRRGKDKKGMTILMFNEKIQPDAAKSMLKGKSDDLLSSFYINYNMLLNSQRLEDIDPDFILARSFLQFQQDSKLPNLMKQHQQKLLQYKSMQMENEQSLQTLYLLQEKVQDYKQKIRKVLFTPQTVLPYLQVGRVIKVKDGSTDWGYGISINFNKKDKNKKLKGQQANDCGLYLIDVMVFINPRKNNENPVPQTNLSAEGQMVVLTFALSCVYEVTALKISGMPSDLNSSNSKQLILKTLRQLTKKKIQNITFKAKNIQTAQLQELVSKCENQIAQLAHLQPQLQEYKKKRLLHEQIRQSAKKIKQSSGIVLKKEKKSYNRVIKKTGLVQKGVVTLKGSVACEISSGHQILLTDLLFAGYFNDLNPIQIASILTCLVHDEKSQTDRKFTKIPKVKAKLDQLINNAKNIFKIFHECKVSMQQDEYLGSIKQQLIQVAYQWCHGGKFQKICSITDSYEGTIIRTLRRLHQLLRQLSKAAIVIGNQQLASKFQESSNKIYRGLVSAASLYLV